MEYLQEPQGLVPYYVGFLSQLPNPQYCCAVSADADCNGFLSGTAHYNSVFHPYSMYSRCLRFMGRKKGAGIAAGYKSLKKLTFTRYLFLGFHKNYNLFCKKALRRLLRSPFKAIRSSLNKQNKSFALQMMHIEDKPEILAFRVCTKKFVTARP